MTIEILLVDDQHLMLEGIKTILKHEPGIEIVGTAQDGQSAIAQVIKLRPDLVLIDIEMPRMNGIVATKYICQNIPHTRVIVLTSHKQQDYITEALRAGASGYLLKTTLIQDLKQAIYSLDRGYSYLEAKSSIPQASRISTGKIARYKKQIFYSKRYRKSIYKPTANRQSKTRKQRVQSQVLSPNSSATSGITKASLAPIFDLTSSTAPSFASAQTTRQNPPIPSQPKFDRQRYLKRIAFMLIAIASFILSIIIF